MNYCFNCHIRFLDHIFFIKFITIIPSLLLRAAEAAFSLIDSLRVVGLHVSIKIGLHLLDGCVEGRSEGHRVKLVLDDLIESFCAPLGCG
jgi:hypothetical protein